MSADGVPRRWVLKSIGSGAAAFSAGATRFCCTPNRDHPNILFIMSDDHAAQAISAYGSAINSTPHIDRLATEGMLFRNCFCTNSICAPSRATILTGKYSHLNGLLDNKEAFDGSQQTFPKLLQAAGYETALVGKWHLKSDPTGFDYWNILPGQGEYYNPVMIELGVEKRSTGYVSDIITNEALRWLKNRNTEKPFCLLLHHKAPHANWEPGEKYADMYSDTTIPEPETFNDDYKTRADAIRMHRLMVGRKQWELHYSDRFGDIPSSVSEKEIRSWMYQRYMKDYLRCVASVDDNVGRVLDYLDDSGLVSNTVVSYAADQGFFLGEHGLYDKRFMYEESLRMPFLVRYPGEIRPGSEADAMALNLDFAETILDFAGVSIPDDMRGRSLRPIFRGQIPGDWRTSMYYRFYEEAYGVGSHEGVRTERYKLIYYHYGKLRWELFDLRQDPNELNNIYDDPQNAQLVADLKSEMAHLKAKYGVKENN